MRKRLFLVVLILTLGAVVIGCSASLPSDEEVIEVLVGKQVAIDDLARRFNIEEIETLAIISDKTVHKKGESAQLYADIAFTDSKANVKAEGQLLIDLVYGKEDGWQLQGVQKASPFEFSLLGEFSEEDLRVLLEDTEIPCYRPHYPVNDMWVYRPEQVSELNIISADFVENEGIVVVLFDLTLSNKVATMSGKYVIRAQYNYPGWTKEKITIEEQNTEYNLLGTWTGFFEDDRGRAAVELELIDIQNGRIRDAELRFGPHEESPDMLSGSYKMIGTWSEYGLLIMLDSRAWIEEPDSHYWRRDFNAVLSYSRITFY